MNAMSWRYKFVYVFRITVFLLDRIICSTAVSFDIPWPYMKSKVMVRPKNYTFFFFLWLVLWNSYCLSPSGMLHLYRVYLTFWWSASHSGFCCLEQWTILCVSFGQPWATVYLFRLSSFCGFAGALVVYVFSHGPCVCGLGIHPCETCLHVWGFIDFTCHQPHR